MSAVTLRVVLEVHAAEEEEEQQDGQVHSVCRCRDLFVPLGRLAASGYSGRCGSSDYFLILGSALRKASSQQFRLQLCQDHARTYCPLQSSLP